MHKILVTLPSNRDFAGHLHLLDETGNILLGPFAVAGRSDDSLAKRHQNSSRNPLLPYGDTPCGRYRVTHTIAVGDASGYDPKAYGPNGILVLEAIDGDAALADAHGRFRFLIQGGPPDANGKLRATSGSLRLTNTNQRALVKAVQSLDRVICECVENQQLQLNKMIAGNSGYMESDPPPLTRLNDIAAPQAATGRLYSAGNSHGVPVFVQSPFAASPEGLAMLAMGGGGGAYSTKLTYAQVKQIVDGNNNCSLSSELLVCLIWKESGFDPGVTNPGSTATGLMQMTKGAVQTVNNTTPPGVHYEITDMTDPIKNVQCGTYYLRYLLSQNPDTKTALERYGTGPGYGDNILTCESCLQKKPTPSDPGTCLHAIHS